MYTCAYIYSHMHTTSSGQIAPLQRSSYSQEEETCLAEDSGFWARFFVIVRCLAIWYISHCALNIEYRSADVRKCMSSKMRLKLWKIEHVCYVPHDVHRTCLDAYGMHTVTRRDWGVCAGHSWESSAPRASERRHGDNPAQRRTARAVGAQLHCIYMPLYNAMRKQHAARRHSRRAATVLPSSQPTHAD